MPGTRELAGLAELRGAYDVLFCDIWGVIHDGARAFPAACDALARWRRESGPVVLISNSPRPWDGVAAQLQDLGASPDIWSAIVTSGDACRVLLAERSPGPAWRIGPDRDAPLYEGLDLAFADEADAAFISCSGLDDDERQTPEDYRTRLQRAADRGLEMVCANPDIVVQRGARLIWCAGALAELYESLGGRVASAGKPHPPIYGLARDAADLALGRPLDARRILVLGDGLVTDIAGAHREGLDALFVAGGIHAGELIDHAGVLELAAAERLLAERALSARFAIRALIW